jgi:hypothetical protein
MLLAPATNHLVLPEFPVDPGFFVLGSYWSANSADCAQAGSCQHQGGDGRKKIAGYSVEDRDVMSLMQTGPLRQRVQ